jgi:adenylate cyclase
MNDSRELPQRLAAILAADAVGFSREMARDERATLAALEKARAVFRAEVADKGGRVVDTAGDSVLAVFDSASAAVSAALQVQATLQDTTGEAPDSVQLRYRIGIHLGEVLTQPDGSIYGDGVNTAARLQTIAEPGHIVVSAAVHGAVGTRLGVGFDDLGEREFKNIASPLRAFQVRVGAASAGGGRTGARRRPKLNRTRLLGLLAAVLAAAAVGLWALKIRPSASDGAGSASARTLSVAVLPFTAPEAEPADAAWAESLTGALANALSRWPYATVAAPGRARVLQRQHQDPGEIGRTLQARYLVEGEVAPRGGKLVVATRVIDAETGQQFWGSELEPPPGAGSDERELLQMRVISRVRRVLFSALVEQWRRLPDQTPEALVAGGLNAWSNNDNTGWREASEFFNRALQVDPRFGEAILMRGLVLQSEYSRDPNTPKPELLSELEAVTAQAIAVNPGNDLAWHLRSIVLMHLQRFGEAFAAADRAIELAPYEANWRAGRAGLLALTGRQQEAETLLLRAIAMDPPGYDFVHSAVCLSRLLMGHYDEALPYCEFAAAHRQSYEDQMLLAAIHAQRGDTAKALIARTELLKQQPGATLANNYYLRMSAEPEYRRQVEERLIAGLRKAGVPER